MQVAGMKPSETKHPLIGRFVKCCANDLGVGKIHEVDHDHAVIEYFDTPVGDGRHFESLPFDCLESVTIQRQARVYFYDRDAGFWRMGRVESHVLDVHNGNSLEDVVYIALPNKSRAVVNAAEVFVRWSRPLGDPWAHLESRLTETPYFHNARSDLLASLVAQRAASSGMTALLSAPIELERHQIEVVHRVLTDPIQRYLLADEVGLGKTIEAGVILRQHLLDAPASHSALIVVPEGLVLQWKRELKERCQICPEVFGHKVEVVTYSEALHWQGGGADFIIVDEAHQIVGNARLYERIREMSDPAACPKLLLLSATPVLGNEDGFLDLLHLLDPFVNRIEDRALFKERVANRQELANLFGEFVEEQDVYHLSTVIADLKNHFPGDKRLSDLLDRVSHEVEKAQAEAAYENPTALRQAVGRARSHLSESYRLHRRILRNRRDAGIEGVLTGRERLVAIEFEDFIAGELEASLDNWRSAAASYLWGRESSEHALPLARWFAGMIDAVWCDPEAVLEMVRLRLGKPMKGSRDYGPLLNRKLLDLAEKTPLFEGEIAALEGILDLEERLGFARANRLKRLCNIVRDVCGLDERITRLAFFSTSPVYADDLFEKLLRTFGEKVVTRHSTQDDEWESRWKRPGVQFLVCDWTAEQGLNLQGGNTCLIHMDLPFSPNRLEQRIGRLDRFGVGNPVLSVVLYAGDCPFYEAWNKCLDEGWNVFSNSIAALQYVVDEEMEVLTQQLLLEGNDAIHAATERLSGDDGIRRELRMIRNQDSLDAIETSYQEESWKLLESLEEINATANRFGEVVDAWVLKRLHFERVGEGNDGDDVFRYHYRSTQSGPQTLIARNDFLRWFDGAIDSNAPHPRFRQPISFPMSYSRQVAKKRNVGLSRLGTPWIDSLQAYAREDDRGNSFALWRQVDECDLIYGETARAFFRLDYIVEPAFDGDVDVAIRRKADAGFSPIYKTLWIDQNLSEPDEALIEWLEEPYCNHEDVNIRADYWKQVLEMIDLGDWAGLCEQVRTRSEGILMEQTNLKELIETRVNHFELKTQIGVDQAVSRLEIFGADHAGMECDLETYKAEATRIISAIRVPRVRLDSCGVMFLSKVPFVPEKMTGIDQ
jgi:ATP-dependent helicase HepA